MAFLIPIFVAVGAAVAAGANRVATSIDNFEKRITKVALDVLRPLGDRTLDEVHHATNTAGEAVHETVGLGHAAVEGAGAAAAGAIGLGHHGLQAAAGAVRVGARTADGIAARAERAAVIATDAGREVATEAIHTLRALTAATATSVFGLSAYFLAARTKPSDDLLSYAVNRTLLTGGALLALSGGVRSAQLVTRIWTTPAPRRPHPLAPVEAPAEPAALPLVDQDPLLQSIWPVLRAQILPIVNGAIAVPALEMLAPAIRAWLNTPQARPFLTHVTELNLSERVLFHFPADLALFSNLRVLRLDNNHIDHLAPDALHPFPELRDLSLSHNRLRTLPPDLFARQAHLETLNLSHNHLTHLPEDVLKPLGSLRTCNFWDNALRALPRTLFWGLRNLETLRLDYNRIEQLEEEQFQGLARLRILGLINNLISTLPPTVFQSLSGLIELYLDYNRLIFLPDCVFHPIQATLVRLHVRWNQLTTLPDRLFRQHFPHLHWAYFNHNLFRGITRESSVFDDIRGTLQAPPV